MSVWRGVCVHTPSCACCVRMQAYGRVCVLCSRMFIERACVLCVCVCAWVCQGGGRSQGRGTHSPKGPSYIQNHARAKTHTHTHTIHILTSTNLHRSSQPRHCECGCARAGARVQVSVGAFLFGSCVCAMRASSLCSFSVTQVSKAIQKQVYAHRISPRRTAALMRHTRMHSLISMAKHGDIRMLRPWMHTHVHAHTRGHVQYTHHI